MIKVSPVRQTKPIKIYKPPKRDPGLPSPDSATNKLSVGRINVLFSVGDMTKESLYTRMVKQAVVRCVTARCGAVLCSSGHVMMWRGMLSSRAGVRAGRGWCKRVRNLWCWLTGVVTCGTKMIE